MGRKRKLDIENQMTNENSNSSETGGLKTNLNGIQRLAANDRERTRMRVLSKAFVRLKTSLPWVPTDTKLSKLDTLKLATSYISYLTRILSDDRDGDADTNGLLFQPPNHHQNFHNHNQSPTATSSSSSSSSVSKMMPSIRLSSFDMQRIINEHLSNTNTNNNNNNTASNYNYGQNHYHHHNQFSNHTQRSTNSFVSLF